MNPSTMIGSVIVIAMCVGLFLLLREFWCWYWKINERNQLLRDILMTLREVPVSQPYRSPAPSAAKQPAAISKNASMWICACGSINEVGKHRCPECGFVMA
jgi:hypothetical protein